MALSDVWARTLVYFGIAEEDDWDDEGYLTEDELADPYEQQNVRRLPARRSRRGYDDDWTDPEPEADLQRTSILRPQQSSRRLEWRRSVAVTGHAPGMAGPLLKKDGLHALFEEGVVEGRGIGRGGRPDGNG